MNLRKLTLQVTLLLSVVCFDAIGQQVVVYNGASPIQMLNTIIGNNISVSNVYGTFAPAAKGTFTNSGAYGVPFSEGIMLGTGPLYTTELNMSSTYYNNTDLNQPGDPDLNNFLGINITEDASVLEFDFMAWTDSVEFNFVLASEDYNENVNSNLADVFAFFLNGPGYLPNTNLAMLPIGNSAPISVNSVNNGNSSGVSNGPCLNCSYYIDNVADTSVELSYDGFTTVFKIKFKVWPCSEYQMKIAIADVTDGYSDSMIMIEDSSFKGISQVSIYHAGQPVGNGDTLFLCQGGSVTLSAPPAPNYSWSTGDTTQTITVTQPGIYQYLIFGNLGCFAYSQSVIVAQQGTPIQTPVIAQSGNLLYSPNLVPTPNMTFQWYLNGVAIPGAFQTTCNISGLGCYMLIIYDGICESNSNEVCIGVSAPEIEETHLKIYPHPVTGISVLETPFTEQSVSVLDFFDISGRHIKTEYHEGGVIEISNKGFEKGVYILHVSNSQVDGTLHRTVIFK